MSIEIPQDVVEMNQEILSALKADCVDLSRKYTVEHHFSSSNFTLLEKLAVELFQTGFEIIDPDEIEEEGVRFFCFDALKLCRISDETPSANSNRKYLNCCRSFMFLMTDGVLIQRFTRNNNTLAFSV